MTVHAAILMGSPAQQYFDNNGKPLAGGTLTFEAAGTSSPQNTYSDSTLSTPNANPLTLDSSGRSTTMIYCSAASYKVIIKDSNGVVLGTYDNYQVATPF